MVKYNSQPDNLNPLSPLSFTFQIDKAPAVTFFCQSVTIPNIHMNFIRQNNPMVASIQPSTEMDFGELNIEFQVDENLKNWMEIYNWMVEIAFPESFSQFNENEVFHDATLTVLTNKENPFYRFNFKDCFPSNLGELEFTTTDEGTVMTSSVEFAYTRYVPEKI